MRQAPSWEILGSQTALMVFLRLHGGLHTSIQPSLPPPPLLAQGGTRPPPYISAGSIPCMGHHFNPTLGSVSPRTQTNTTPSQPPPSPLLPPHRQGPRIPCENLSLNLSSLHSEPLVASRPLPWFTGPCRICPLSFSVLPLILSGCLGLLGFLRPLHTAHLACCSLPQRCLPLAAHRVLHEYHVLREASPDCPT